jgi:hypothetical protein
MLKIKEGRIKYQRSSEIKDGHHQKQDDKHQNDKIL